MKENPYDPPTTRHREPKVTEVQNTSKRYYIGMMVLSLIFGLVLWNGQVFYRVEPFVQRFFSFVFIGTPFFTFVVTIASAEKRIAGITGHKAVKRSLSFALLVLALIFAGCVFFFGSCTGTMLFSSSLFPAGGRSYGPSEKAWTIALTAALFFSNVIVYLIYGRCRSRFLKNLDI